MSANTQSTIKDSTKRIAILFDGYSKAHGTYVVKRTSDRGKAEGKALTVQRPATPDVWDAHVAGTGPGIGIVPLRDDNTVVWGCIDIDVYNLKHEELEKKIRKLELPLVVARSKSGGAHCFLFLSEPSHAAFIQSYLIHCASALGHAGCEVFPKQVGRENDDTGNWLNMPYYDADQTLRFAFKDGVPLDLGEFLEYAESMRVDPSGLTNPELPPSELPAPSKNELARFKLPEEIGEGSRNEVLFKFASSLQARGWADDAIRAELIRVNTEVCKPPMTCRLHEEDWHPKKYKLEDDELGWVFKQATRYEKGNPVPDWVAQMNAGHAVVVMKGKTVVANTDDYDPQLERRAISYSTFTDFKNAYMNRYVPVGEDSKPAPAGAAWLAHPMRRQYAGVTFLPGKQTSEDWLNMWSGFSYEPDEKGDWSLMKEHILVNLCDGKKKYYDYLLNWMAFTVQYPHIVPEVAIVLLGGRGTGKSIVANTLGALMREHYISVSNQEHVSGRFNAHLADTLLLFLDEAMWAGDKKGEGTLKRLITDKYIPIEKKRVDVGMQRNFCHLIVASNSDWAVPAGLDERRFFVLHVSDAKKQNHEYFAAIQKQLDEENGYAGMLHELLHRDLTDFNPRAAPMTEALLEQKIHTLDKKQAWWLECLVEGRIDVPKGFPTAQYGDGWPEQASKAELLESYHNHAARTSSKQHSGTALELGIFLSKVLPKGWLDKDGPNNVRNMAVYSSFQNDDGEDKESSDVAPGYKLPPLAAARGAWDARTGGLMDWPSDEEGELPF
ncbi:MAG: DUF5906 domain-containing protein [Pseudomonadota bacterium]|nr:DUF5906 domain-containing protein [Pseudomonadota bacterium]